MTLVASLSLYIYIVYIHHIYIYCLSSFLKNVAHIFQAQQKQTTGKHLQGFLQLRWAGSETWPRYVGKKYVDRTWRWWSSDVERFSLLQSNCHFHPSVKKRSGNQLAHYAKTLNTWTFKTHQELGVVASACLCRMPIAHTWQAGYLFVDPISPPTFLPKARMLHRQNLNVVGIHWTTPQVQTSNIGTAATKTTTVKPRPKRCGDINLCGCGHYHVLLHLYARLFGATGFLL